MEREYSPYFFLLLCLCKSRFQDTNQPSSHFLAVFPSVIIMSVTLLTPSPASLKLVMEGLVSGFVLVKVRTLASTVGRGPQAERVRPVCALSLDQLVVELRRHVGLAGVCEAFHVPRIGLAFIGAPPRWAVSKEGSSQRARLAPDWFLSRFKF